MPNLKLVKVVEHSELHQQYRPFSDGSLTPPLTSFERLDISYCAMSSEGPQDPIENLTPDEANRIIHSHRKVRYGKRLPLHQYQSQPATVYYNPTSLSYDAKDIQVPHAGHVGKEK